MVYVGVIGAGFCSSEVSGWAEAVGAGIARRQGVLICGGMGGVMEAAARGARREGGLVVGVLPGNDRKEGNPHLSLSLATGLGDARNAVIARASDVLIAIDGGYGTLSEIGLALKMGRPVVGLGTWRIESSKGPDGGIIAAADPEEAVALAFREAGRIRPPER
ncbi:MAG: TIGR00725 family protein [Bacillota bacterium]